MASTALALIPLAKEKQEKPLRKMSCSTWQALCRLSVVFQGCYNTGPTCSKRWVWAEETTVRILVYLPGIQGNVEERKPRRCAEATGVGWEWVRLKSLSPGRAEGTVLRKKEQSYRSRKIGRPMLALSRKSCWGPAAAEGRGRGASQRDSQAGLSAK